MLGAPTVRAPATSELPPAPLAPAEILPSLPAPGPALAPPIAPAAASAEAAVESGAAPGGIAPAEAAPEAAPAVERPAPPRDTPGPTVDPAPSPPPALPAGPELLDVDWEKAGKKKGKTIIRFTARARCGAGCSARLDVRPTGREWESEQMNREGDGRFSLELPFPQSATGHVRWVVTLTDARGTAQRGTRDRPMDFFLR